MGIEVSTIDSVPTRLNDFSKAQKTGVKRGWSCTGLTMLPNEGCHKAGDKPDSKPYQKG